MEGRGKGYAVKYNGKNGILFKEDQNKKFRCKCCGNPVSSEGKSLITPADEFFGIDESKRKTIVKNSKIKIVGFIE